MVMTCGCVVYTISLSDVAFVGFCRFPFVDSLRRLRNAHLTCCIVFHVIFDFWFSKSIWHFNVALSINFVIAFISTRGVNCA